VTIHGIFRFRTFRYDHKSAESLTRGQLSYRNGPERCYSDFRFPCARGSADPLLLLVEREREREREREYEAAACSSALLALNISPIKSRAFEAPERQLDGEAAGSCPSLLISRSGVLQVHTN